MNRHNYRYWAPNNPHWNEEIPLHSQKITVWAAIGRQGLFGPFFFSDSVNSERYLNMLSSQLWPLIQQRHLENDLIFMQDGAPPHWGLSVRKWLDEHFAGRWMGRGSPNMPWPPRSPDLTPCDYFLWGYVKSVVYKQNPLDIEELKTKITEAMLSIPQEMINRSIENFEERMSKLLENGGSHIEIFL